MMADLTSIGDRYDAPGGFVDDYSKLDTLAKVLIWEYC